MLLIVPYGIETLKRRGTHDVSGLLIVPYGIETLVQLCYAARQHDF